MRKFGLFSSAEHVRHQIMSGFCWFVVARPYSPCFKTSCLGTSSTPCHPAVCTKWQCPDIRTVNVFKSNVVEGGSWRNGQCILPHLNLLQMRWSGVLSNLLHTLRHKLTLTIDWRPLYHLMRHTFTDPVTGMEGDDLLHTEQGFTIKILETDPSCRCMAVVPFVPKHQFE